MVSADQTIVANNARVISDRKVILEQVTLSCCRGEWVLLTGASGAGKSTLLNMLNGLCSLDFGSVTTLGACRPGATRIQNRKVWSQCGTVLQEIALFDCLDVESNVILPLKRSSLSRKERSTRALHWLERLGLKGLEKEYPVHLSGGQRQRVALARAFVADPKVLFLDEPFSALDEKNTLNIANILEEYASNGATILMSSHQINLVKNRCDTMLEVVNGSVRQVSGVVV